jgi:hypothetical protein
MKTLKTLTRLVRDYLDYRRYGFNRKMAWHKAKVTI